MNTMNFRLATLDDLTDILFIIEQARERMKHHHSGQWQDGTPSKETIMRDIDGHHFFVATRNNLIVGVTAVLDYEEAYQNLIVGQWTYEGPYKVIHRFAVHKDYLHQGVASFMLESIEHMAINEGVKLIRIDTHEKNIEMLNFLRKQGFINCGTTYIEKTKIRLVFEKLI